MAQHDYVIDNSTGANVRADLNNALLAISSTNSGSSAPSTTYAFQLFANTTTSKLQIRNAGNSAFVDLIGLDGSILLPDGSVSSPSLAFSDDLNTGIFSSAADTFNVATGGVERMELGAATVFNEDGADVDFRIEGDTDTNLFRLDASTDRIGIGVSTPQQKLHIGVSDSGAANIAFTNSTTGSASGDGLVIGLTGGEDGQINMQESANLKFSTADTERMRIDSSGRVLIGHSSHVHNAGIEAHLQLIGTGTDDTSIILSRYSNDGSSPFLVFSKSRATNIGDNIVLQNGDRIGRIKFFGNDGTDDDTPAAEIDVEVDGTPGSNDMPGRIVFKTTADGASSTTTRMTIDSSGQVGIGNTSGGGRVAILAKSTSYQGLELQTPSGDSSGEFHIGVRQAGASSGRSIVFRRGGTDGMDTQTLKLSSDGKLMMGTSGSLDMGFGPQVMSVRGGSTGGYAGNAAVIFGQTDNNVSVSDIYASASDYAATMTDMRAARTNSDAFAFMQMSSSSGADNEFIFRGNGNALADGSFTGGGADYAEYFEWSDGNSSDEDRRGYTVVLDGNKVRKSTSSDAAATIIGVVSSNPSIIGDGDLDKWKQKYKKDDYGSYLRDSNGERILNPDWDESLEYVSREKRKEWSTIGLMGKIRIRKGQIMGTNWIKMQDISDTVEEWLVK